MVAAASGAFTVSSAVPLEAFAADLAVLMPAVGADGVHRLILGYARVELTVGTFDAHLGSTPSRHMVSFFNKAVSEDVSEAASHLQAAAEHVADIPALDLDCGVRVGSAIHL